jgi:16S rRNA (adenine1518-N6/adenine1519-N6)-dimethyltransferase
LETSLSLPEKTLIVGNLPYYITSPILRKFFEGKCQLNAQVVGGIFMVQEEVGEKIRYDAKKKSYLYWLLNYAYQVEYIKSVPAKAFSPAPKVKSCIISLVKKAELPQLSFEKLQAFLDAFSPYSRKTLGKIAKMLQKKGTSFSIPEQFASKRLEELSWEELELTLQA